MRETSLLLGCFIALSAAQLPAQITLINNAPRGPGYATTTGTSHSIDVSTRVNALLRASCKRTTAAANASYLATGIALDPESNGFANCANAAKGYTIQFWYRPTVAATFQYLFGDRTWLGASGAFRCFQNGAANSGQTTTGNLYVRGPLTQLRTTSGPLINGTNAQGWVHLAFVQNNATKTATWYVNGKQEVTGNSTGTTKGTDFTCMGYNGSAAAGATGHFDDYRVYNWARTAADIAADFAKLAAGKGSSGCDNRPDFGYYRCEAAVNPHIATARLLKEPGGMGTRLFTNGDTIEWTANSPATGPFAAICMMNLFLGGPGKPRIDAYQRPTPLPNGPYNTAIVPGLVLGSSFSTPPLPFLFWPVPVAYGANKAGVTGFPVPNLGWKNGDRIDLQWIVLDKTYPPLGYGTTNNLTFQFIAPRKAKHAVHVEARGINVIQNTGFWEVWNEGTVAIKEVCIDFATLPSTASTNWDVGGALNSGGTLSAGTSFRYQTDAICDLTPAMNPRYQLSANRKKLCFTFACPSAPANGFQGPTNHFAFDCDTAPARAGSGYIGATVTVTFCDNTQVTGTLKADPNDTNAAQVDL